MSATSRRSLPPALRRAVTGLLACSSVLGGAAASSAAAPGDVVETPLQVVVGAEPDGAAVTLDASVFTRTGASGTRPGVVLAHGYGGSKIDLVSQATELAEAGYVVATYSARGSGASGGRIHLGAPEYEGADAVAVVGALAEREDVAREGGADSAAGDPVVGVAGASYGGAAALMAGSLDPRVDAVAAAITWHDLRQSLVPQAATVLDPATGAPQAAGAPGVLKQGWVSQLLASGTGTSGDGGSPGEAGRRAACGRLDPGLCAAYLATTERGGSPAPSPVLLDLLTGSSPARAIERGDGVPPPTLLVQGEADTLFGLEQSLLTARALRERGGEVAVSWSPGGHDAVAGVQAELTDGLRGWFDRHLLPAAGSAPGSGAPADPAPPAFEYALPLPALAALVGGGGAGDDGGGDGGAAADADAESGSTDDDLPVAERRSLPRAPSPVPPPDGPGRSRAVPLAGAPAGAAQPVVSPAGGQPAARTSLPGLGAVGSLPGLAGAGVPPGQAAVFESAPLAEDLPVLGASTVDLTVTSSAADAVLFAALYDVDEAGRATLPGGLVAPLRVQAPPGSPTTVRVTLPTVVLDALAGHRLRLVVSSTDAAYAVPDDARAYTVALSGDDGLRLALADTGAEPVATAAAATSLPVPQAVVAASLVAAALLLAVVAGARARRRARGAEVAAAEPRPADEGPAGGGADDGGAAPPALVVTDLTKEYADGHRAVDGASFTVERGRVVGLLGPNGAGKTTTLRVLLGLLRPTSGTVEVLGRPVVPGAPVLARVGALVEGPGFLPHLTGAQNLAHFWRATGRPAEEAHLEEALAVADLGTATSRRVRSYSQGMRMRLGIAQAVLGLPELLVLDEPTNGLDPPQITAMRQVLRDYAATGRTVLLSSHLLSEVEQTCSHVVVMSRGRVLAAGSVADLAGAGTALVLGVAPGQAGRARRVLEGLPGVRVSERAPAAAPAAPSAPGGSDDEVLVELVGPADPGALVAALVRAGVQVRSLVPQHRLEEAFLALVGHG